MSFLAIIKPWKQKKRAQTEAVKTSLTEPDTSVWLNIHMIAGVKVNQVKRQAPTEGKVTLSLCICLKGFNSEEKTKRFFFVESTLISKRNSFLL